MLPYQQNSVTLFVARYSRYLLALIPLISILLHWHVFSMDLVGIHVWRQTETQTVINNFATEDFNILHPRINGHADTDRLHRMEFPLMQWCFALFYKLFGPHIIISRLLSFFIGLCSVYGMYFLCRIGFNNRLIAGICAWCFNFSPVFYYYTLNPMPDNLALCCGIWSIGLFCAYLNGREKSNMVWSAVLLGLAVLVKLPFVIYGAFMLPFIIPGLYAWSRSAVQVVCVYAVCLIPAAAWYITVIPGWDNVVIRGVFSSGDNIRLVDVFTGTIVSTLPELLINYGSVFFFITGIYLVFRNKVYRRQYFPHFAAWGCAVMAYFLYEMNAIALVHDYYLFPFLPLIFLLVAYGGYHLVNGRAGGCYFVIFCLLLLPLTAFLRIDSRWSTADPGFNPVYYKSKEQIRRLIPPGALCVAGNDPSGYILLYYIGRKGWTFDGDQLDDRQLNEYGQHGATYLFCDGNADVQPAVKALLSEKIFDKGALRIYKLK